MPYERVVVKKARQKIDLIDPRAKLIKTSGEGEPDLVGAVLGRAVAIECKQPGEQPTKLQMWRLAEWAKSGAVALWFDGVDWYKIGPNRMQTRDGLVRLLRS